MDSFECFWGRVGARRMKLGDDGLVKGGQSRAELFSRTKDGKILLYPRVDSNSNCTFLGISSFFYCEFVRQSVQFKHISFFSRASRIEKSAAFPNVSRRVWKRLANNFSFRKIGGNDHRWTARQRERISVWNRREIWQDGWFPRSWARNVEGAIVSRNGNHRHQRDVKEFLAVSGLRVERRSGQFRPRGKVWKFDRNY